MEINSYKDLIAWQKSMKLVGLIYEMTGDYPKTEMFGLVSQIRRAAISIPSNIAEGWARRGLGEYVQFLYISYASAAEVETQLIIGKELGFGKSEKYKEIEDLSLEVQKILFGLIKKLKSKI